MSHSVPGSDPSRDPLFKMRVHQLARELIPDCWADSKLLLAEPITTEVAPQLYASVGSIAANTGEAYSKSSGKDRARIFEIALGSVRESMEWYNASKPVLGDDTTTDRMKRLEEMRRLLLAIIPRERGRSM